MEARAPYGTLSAPADLRELVALVAAWLANTGFQEVACGPAAGESVTLDARWEGVEQAFRVLLQATPHEARCHLWSREQGMLFTWQRVRSLPQLQELLTKHPAFRATSLF